MDKPCGEIILLVVLVGLQSSGGPGDVSVVVVICFLGGGVSGLLGQVKPFLAGLLVHLKEVAAVVVIVSFQGCAAVVLAVLEFGDFHLPPVNLFGLMCKVVLVKVLE